MAPQRRGVVPPAHADRLLAAKRNRDDADQEYRDAVAAALKAGASVREVARLTGLSTNTVDRWGRAGGWPTEEQKAAWEAARAGHDEWDAMLRTLDALTDDEE